MEMWKWGLWGNIDVIFHRKPWLKPQLSPGVNTDDPYLNLLWCDLLEHHFDQKDQYGFIKKMADAITL